MGHHWLLVVCMSPRKASILPACHHFLFCLHVANQGKPLYFLRQDISLEANEVLRLV